jgi:hypothetical protein
MDIMIWLQLGCLWFCGGLWLVLELSKVIKRYLLERVEGRGTEINPILSAVYLQSNRDTYFGTTPAPSFSEAIMASFHLSTHKHHRHPSFNPGNPGRCVIRSLPIIHQSCLTSDLKTTVTPLLAELEETIRDYCPDKVFSWILIRSPAVSISEKASRVGRVRRGG